jgi:hypothetical protein
MQALAAAAEVTLGVTGVPKMELCPTVARRLRGVPHSSCKAVDIRRRPGDAIGE